MTKNRAVLALSMVLLTGWSANAITFGQMPMVTRQERILGDRIGSSYGILEGGARVKATVTQVKPVEQVVIVLDGSGSMVPIYARIVEELRKALPSQTAVPTAIARFSAQKTFLQDFTTSRAALDEALVREQRLWSSGGSGDATMKTTTDLYGVLAGLKDISQSKMTHFIIITDGNDSLNDRVDLSRLVGENMVVSYLNWGYRSFSARVDEANAVVITGSGSRKMDVPNVTLRFIVRKTGGDMVNYTDWKTFGSYIKRRLSQAGAVYQATWESANPEIPFSLSAK
ncbi:MAG: hypothetical protein SNJ67_09725 [Chloracidobacterium sp.]|uniref:VWFA domain-containing protein n=1 Tax=Chloracidobacterium validum TaxID=2821543 RepID=A0ABX8BAW5_9BACT|nr:hypothetical protein [Chloracidobacterium validum]QUW04076.1 hypothetical protein J8C06_13565 [Chloracidobacterium validum]